jgi:TonB-linked SusC/RagA family outer membrane protein
MNVEQYSRQQDIGWQSYFLAFFFWLGLTAAANAQVTGTVTDQSSNEPLIGVNIIIKGKTSLGTITDIDGSYTISANAGDTLVFSYTGYATTEISIPDPNGVLDISLSFGSQILDEIVVVGYGAVVKKDLTGVVTKIESESFNKGIITSPEGLLNGKVAGLQISNNAEPGGGNRIRLRGATSLGASSDPLIVVDGVPLDNVGGEGSRNRLNFLNSADVESMTVLKDASASAIYGSRGANGVIIITTKSGKSGKMRVSYNGNANISTFSATPANLSPSNFRAAISAKAPQEFDFLGDQSTDWVSEVIGNAWGTDHNLSVSGGLDRISYLLSGGYLKNDGVLNTSAHEATSLSANISTKLFNDQLLVNIKSKAGFTTDIFAPNVIGAALTFDPTRPVLDPDSKFGGYYQWADPLAVNNPVSTLNSNNQKGETVRTLNNLTLEYRLPFISGLSLHSNVSYDRTDGDRRNFRDPLLKDGDNYNRGGYLFLQDERLYAALIESFVTWKADIPGSNSSLELTSGHSWQQFDREYRWTQGFGLEQEGNDWIYTQDINADSFLVENRLISFFGRLNYTHNNRYLLTASLRRDGSSRFGESNRWGLFPAVAVGWRILEEDFARDWNNLFSNLKLRVSWGITGNENIGDFLYNTFYEYGTGDATYQFGDEFVPTLRGRGVDPDIKWEQTTSLNVGIDFGFLNNRLSGSIEGYRKYTNDLLFTVAASAFTNLSDRILTNIGEMENIGVELQLDAVVIDQKNFSWDLGFNFAHNRNEIKKLDNSTDPNFLGYEAGGISGDIGQTIQVLKVGESIETFRTYKHILNENGLPRPDGTDYNGDGLIDNLDIYEDLNGDGLINENDLLPGKSALPDFIFGLTSNFRYQNWDLAATFRAHLGNYVYNNVASGSGYFQRLTDRVTNNIHESAFIVNFTNRQLKSDYYIEDASFLRLDNVSLGYNIQAGGPFRSLRLSATVQNVFVLTGYSGLDPEIPQFSGGIDNNTYPVSRRFILGVNANF